MSKWCSSSPPPQEQLRMYSSQIGGDTFIDYEKNEELSELLKGKKIALVGPSTNLKDKKMGSFIDSFDLVIRPGQLTEIPKTEHEDYGSRTDIIFHSFNVWEKIIALKNLDFLSSLKYVIGCMVCVYECGEYKKFMNTLIDSGVKFHKPDDRYIFKNFDAVGTTLSCGFSSLLLLLNYDIDSVYLTGMDFYNMGKYGKVYRDDYYDTVTKNSMGFLGHNDSKNLSPSEARTDLHDQPTQIEYLRELLKTETRIKLDEYLTENL